MEKVKANITTAEDKAIMDTSNDVLLTKVYASQLGYFKDDYSKEFLKSKRKMQPIINRGTWARVESFRSIILRFLQTFKDTQVNILSPGAGYDTTFFWLHDSIDQGLIENVTSDKINFIEVDFDEIVVKKIHLLRKNENLLKIAKIEEKHFVHENQINAEHYKLIAQDLRDCDGLKEQFKLFQVNESLPTLVITECVLVYMEGNESKNLLKCMTDYFKNEVICINYEMIKPHDAFGKVMIENLADRGCLLPGFLDFPDEQSQKDRMIECGFTQAECYNMNDVYYKKLNKDEKARIEKLEIFDEFEEWVLLQTHYCLCLGKRISNPDKEALIHI